MPRRRRLQALLDLIDDAFDVAPEHRGIYADAPLGALSGITVFAFVTLAAVNGTIALTMAALGAGDHPAGWALMALFSAGIIAAFARHYRQLTREPRERR